MKTQPCQSPTPTPAPAPCESVTCDVPTFRRTSYYTGKLLTARDFSEEQRYHIDKHRLHNMTLHGWGVVCGLKVKPHPHCPTLRIVVEAGLAIDDCGREIRLLEDVDLLLPQPPAQTTPPNPCPPDPKAPPAPSPKPGAQTPPTPPATETLWICLRYCETPEQFSAAPFDECPCTGVVAQKPNRVSESYCLEITTTEPAYLQKLKKPDFCDLDNCGDLYKGVLDDCKAAAGDCIPLAVITCFTPGQLVNDKMIDNWSPRPLLPSLRKVDQVVRCILEKLPCHKLTHISDFNWTHGADIRSNEFMHRFVGPDRGFDIRFDGNVRKDGINRRSFQVLVVHYPTAPGQPQRMEIAPSQIEYLDQTHIRLRIEELYAKSHLDQHNFEVFISLKCDVILDHFGVPVDGNLLARGSLDGTTYYVDAPTGNGVPGGLFESWFRVHNDKRPDHH